MQSGIKVTHSKDNTNTGGMSGSDMMVLNKIPHLEVNIFLKFLSFLGYYKKIELISRRQLIIL